MTPTTTTGRKKDNEKVNSGNVNIQPAKAEQEGVKQKHNGDDKKSEHGEKDDLQKNNSGNVNIQPEKAKQQKNGDDRKPRQDLQSNNPASCNGEEQLDEMERRAVKVFAYLYVYRFMRRSFFHECTVARLLECVNYNWASTVVHLFWHQPNIITTTW